MADSLSSEQRSALMARIRSSNTLPEMRVRRVAHAIGYRFRLHRCDLPGTPDLAFPRLRKVIFVNGCFWHQHPGCRLARLPKSRREYWIPKLTRNRERDREAVENLQKRGWQSKTIWECETLDNIVLADTILDFLDGVR